MLSSTRRKRFARCTRSPTGVLVVVVGIAAWTLLGELGLLVFLLCRGPSSRVVDSRQLVARLKPRQFPDEAWRQALRRWLFARDQVLLQVVGARYALRQIASMRLPVFFWRSDHCCIGAAYCGNMSDSCGGLAAFPQMPPAKLWPVVPGVLAGGNVGVDPKANYICATTWEKLPMIVLGQGILINPQKEEDEFGCTEQSCGLFVFVPPL